MLDTDIASYIIRGRSPELQSRLMAIDPALICVSVMTHAELKYGLKRLPATHRLHLGVRHFLRIVRILPWDEEAADYYADIRHQLTTNGQPIGELDMMIAAHSLSAGAVLVTNSTKHFERIEAPLAMVNWVEKHR
jgi:tRNA(fMet)-specific endonuclease VapC